MNKSEFVAGLFKRKSIHVVGKNEMVDLIWIQYQAICNLGKELYCQNPIHQFFLNYSQDQLWEWEEERKRRQLAVEMPKTPEEAEKLLVESTKNAIKNLVENAVKYGVPIKHREPVISDELEGMGMGFPKD